MESLNKGIKIHSARGLRIFFKLLLSAFCATCSMGITPQKRLVSCTSPWILQKFHKDFSGIFSISIPGVDRRPSVPVERDDVVWVLVWAFHAGRSRGHPWYCKAGHGGSLLQQTLDVAGRNMSFHHIAFHYRRVTGT